MNEAMLARGLAALADPKFVSELSTQILARRQQRADFARSAVFHRMVKSLAGQPGSIAVDSEEASYFPDKVRIAAGWEFASAEDIKLFFSVMADAHADSVPPGSLEADEDNPFNNCSFQHYGLHVSVMSGQGTFIRISNGR